MPFVAPSFHSLLGGSKEEELTPPIYFGEWRGKDSAPTIFFCRWRRGRGGRGLFRGVLLFNKKRLLSPAPPAPLTLTYPAPPPPRTQPVVVRGVLRVPGGSQQVGIGHESQHLLRGRERHYRGGGPARLACAVCCLRGDLTSERLCQGVCPAVREEPRGCPAVLPTVG